MQHREAGIKAKVAFINPEPRLKRASLNPEVHEQREVILQHFQRLQGY
jgi:hypothetical protein